MLQEQTTSTVIRGDAMKNRRALLLALLSATGPFSASGAFLGIPGNVASENGYDAGGTEPVCRLGRSMYGTLYQSIFEWSESSSRIENPLVSDFEIVGEPELYPRCPNGTDLDVLPPKDIRKDGSLITLQNYSFFVNGTLDLRQWPADIPVTDQDTMEAVIHVVLCDLRSTGFCSPFAHFHTDGADNVTYGDLHEDNHIDSESVRIQVNPQELQNFRVYVPVRVNKSGIFSVLAEVVFFLSNEALYPNPVYVGSVTNIPLHKSAQVMEFRNGPEILETSQRSEIVSYVLIGLSGCVMLFLLFQTFKHRKNQILMLSQGLFLIAMLCSGIVGMVGSIFFNPKNDLYCNMLGPMLVVPVHVFYSIILGRLWRIHAVISPLLLLTLEREQSFSTRMVNFLNRATTCQNRQKVHRKVTHAQLARVVALWASPQIILQILRWVLTPNEVMIVFNEDFSEGMPVCNGIYQNQVPEVLSGVFLVVQFIMMWVLARQSQDLPSLFNEASVIFDVTLVSLIILAVAAIVVAMTRSTTMSPNIQYTIGVLAALAMVLNTSLKLVLPKLRMVWRGEKIIVNRLLADHNRERRETRTSRTVKFDVYEMESKRNISRDEDDDTSEASSIVLVLGGSTAALMDFSDDEEEELQAIAEASLTEEQLNLVLLEQTDEEDNANSETARQRPTLKTAFPRTKPTNQALMRSRRTVVTGGNARSGPCVSATIADSQRVGRFATAFGSVRSFATHPAALGRQQSRQNFEIDYNPKVQNKIVISETEPPTRRLLLRMIDAQRLLTHVNRTVLSGSAVPKEDWDQIRSAAVELGGVFQEDVEFTWESNDNNSIRRRPSPATTSQTGARHTIGLSWNSH